MLEVTVRCRCTRRMAADGRQGPGVYRCGCGNQVTLSGLPSGNPARCPMRRGAGICGGPKRSDDWLCQPCTVKVATTALRDKEVLEQLAESGASFEYHSKLSRRLADRQEAIALKEAETARRLDANRVCVVYYCRVRDDVVKIGATTNLKTRIGVFRARPEDVLAVEPGYFQLEKQRHELFAAQRIVSQARGSRREDFRLDEQLQAHIDKVRQAHGDPFELVERIRGIQLELAEDPSSELTFVKVE